jgi:hypothetical protein
MMPAAVCVVKTAFAACANEIPGTFRGLTTFPPKKNVPVTICDVKTAFAGGAGADFRSALRIGDVVMSTRRVARLLEDTLRCFGVLLAPAFWKSPKTLRRPRVSEKKPMSIAQSLDLRVEVG